MPLRVRLLRRADASSIFSFILSSRLESLAHHRVKILVHTIHTLLSSTKLMYGPLFTIKGLRNALTFASKGMFGELTTPTL